MLTSSSKVSTTRLGPIAVAFSIVLGVVLAAPRPLMAQAANGTLLGSVKDESGSAVPGATVTAVEVRTGISRTAVSNATGNYSFANLAPGLYRIEGELAGFKKFVRESVEVNVNTTVRVDIRLSIGALSESVTVAAETPVLQTDRTDTGRIIEGSQIAEMPLGFNRNFQGMLLIVPGATRPFRPHSEFFNSQDSLSSNVNGQSRLANNVQLEGTDDNHKTGLLTVLIPSAEAIETVAVTTSNYDAEFGRAGGAVTNVTFKSGTNEFKGTGFAFGNTEATVARDPFSSLPDVPETKYLQAGFTLGGPIKHNRLFFFGDYVRTQDDSGRITRADLPEPAFRSGDFSAASTIIYDPATGNPDGTGRHAISEQSDSCRPHQPDRQEDPCQCSAAEYCRRPARGNQLRNPVRQGEADQSGGHQTHGTAFARQQRGGPLQLPEPQDLRSGDLRHLRRDQGIRRVRHQPHTQCGRQLQPHLVDVARAGSPRRA